MDKFYEKTTKIDHNGEVIDEKTRRFYNPFQDGRGYNFKYKSINIKSYLDIPLPECFTDTEVGKVYRLSRHIYSDSNMLAYRSDNRILPLSKEDIRQMVVLHRTKFGPFWNKVLSEKVIRSIVINGLEYFCFNPLYFNSTRYLPLYLYIAFQDELRKHLPDWVIKKYLDMQGEKQDEEAK